MLHKLEIMVANGRTTPWATDLVDRLSSQSVGFHWPASADEALGLARTSNVHVALVDGDVPTIDGGLTLVRRIRQAGIEKPCLLVCSEPDQRILRDALELNVFSVLEATEGCAKIADMVLRVGRQVYNFDYPRNDFVN